MKILSIIFFVVNIFVFFQPEKEEKEEEKEGEEKGRGGVSGVYKTILKTIMLPEMKKLIFCLLFAKIGFIGLFFYPSFRFIFMNLIIYYLFLFLISPFLQPTILSLPSN